ncbi:hypothetical protein GCM10027091_24100 [Streptomyces daliensis]
MAAPDSAGRGSAVRLQTLAAAAKEKQPETHDGDSLTEAAVLLRGRITMRDGVSANRKAAEGVTEKGDREGARGGAGARWGALPDFGQGVGFRTFQAFLRTNHGSRR